jgi:hypothetical protein
VVTFWLALLLGPPLVLFRLELVLQLPPPLAMSWCNQAAVLKLADPLSLPLDLAELADQWTSRLVSLLRCRSTPLLASAYLHRIAWIRSLVLSRSLPDAALSPLEAL